MPTLSLGDAARAGEPPSLAAGSMATPWRLGTAARGAAPALLAYLAVRVVGLLLLTAWAQAAGKSVPSLLGHSWDAVWYVELAEHGYDSGYTHRANPWQSNLAFFPLYPLLMRTVAAVTPLDAMAAGLVLAWLASLLAAWGLFAVGTLLCDRRTGVLLAVAWGVVPHAVVESMAYTEGLFTALAAWSLYAVLTRRWLAAGVLCLAAGLTRPTAAALVPPVVLAALAAGWRRRDGWRPWACVLLAPAGWLGYLAWVGARVGRPDGWFHIQHAGWNSSWDGGRWTVTYAMRVLGRASPLDLYVVSLVLLVAAALFVLTILDRQPWQLLLYSGLVLAMSLGAAGYYWAKARFLLPAFPLLLPVAAGLARTRAPRMVVVVATLALVSGYFGGYLLLVWNHSP